LRPCNTGYEFARRDIKQLTKDEMIEWDYHMGLVCGKCNTWESNNWYIEKLINNYLPDARLICEKCK